MVAQIIQLKSQSRKKCLREPLAVHPVLTHLLSLKYQFKNQVASGNARSSDRPAGSAAVSHLCQVSWIPGGRASRSCSVFSVLGPPDRFMRYVTPGIGQLPGDGICQPDKLARIIASSYTELETISLIILVTDLI